ncbi:hypothetical protein EMCRGX_G020133 [Ephydatia muelleri]
MARLRSARLAKDADDAGTKQSPAAELSVKTDMTGSSVAEQTGTREPSVDELALQTAQKMKERLLRAVTCEVDSGSSYLKREPDILTLESKKSSGHPKAGRDVHQLSSSLDPGIKIKDSVYFEFGVTQACARSGEEMVMKRSVVTSDFETKEKVPAVFPSRHQVEKMKKAESGKSTGKQWFDMAAPELTAELKNDLRALQLRNAIDPKQHYKANDELPKYFQVGRVVAGPAEFYSARIPRRQQKRSLVEELFADEELRRYQKKKHTQLQRQYQSGTHRLKKIKHGKKYKHAAA